MEYYRLKEKFEEEFKEFFARIFECRPPFEITVLQDNDYEKLHDKRSGACLVEAIVKGDPKARNLLLRTDTVKRTIFIRRKGDGVLLANILHEVLHIFYPKLSERIIEKATDVFERAFLCYDILYNDQPNRDFFLKLCHVDDVLRKWAGLPKFETNAIFTYEQNLLKKGD